MMQKHEAAAHFAPAVKEAQMGQEMGLGYKASMSITSDPLPPVRPTS